MTTKTSTEVVSQNGSVPRAEREARGGHRAATLWFTGLSGSGKSTIARAVERELFDLSCRAMLLDGDQLRRGLCSDLGFSEADRRENIRRAGEVAHLLFENGSIVLCAFISPYPEDREHVRRMFPETRFFEIYIECAIDDCRRRDPKGLYAKVDAGLISNFTGVTAPYIPPEFPELTIASASESVATAVTRIIGLLRRTGVIL